MIGATPAGLHNLNRRLLFQVMFNQAAYCFILPFANRYAFPLIGGYIRATKINDVANQARVLFQVCHSTIHMNRFSITFLSDVGYSPLQLEKLVDAEYLVTASDR
jgi:hypothetical protein